MIARVWKGSLTEFAYVAMVPRMNTHMPPKIAGTRERAKTDFAHPRLVLLLLLVLVLFIHRLDVCNFDVGAILCPYGLILVKGGTTQW